MGGAWALRACAASAAWKHNGCARAGPVAELNAVTLPTLQRLLRGLTFTDVYNLPSVTSGSQAGPSSNRPHSGPSAVLRGGANVLPGGASSRSNQSGKGGATALSPLAPSAVAWGRQQALVSGAEPPKRGSGSGLLGGAAGIEHHDTIDQRHGGSNALASSDEELDDFHEALDQLNNSGDLLGNACAPSALSPFPRRRLPYDARSHALLPPAARPACLPIRCLHRSCRPLAKA